jgi:type I restriction enzyme S subunit
MIADLKPYANYEESGQAWLGVVPQHWPLVPNRALFSEVKDRNHPNEEMLSVTITRGIVRQRTLLEGSSKKDSSNLNKAAYKLVQPRDIAYNKMRAWQGAIGVSSLRGIISPAYVVMRLHVPDNLPTYFHHLYRTPQFAKEAERWSYGITSDMWSLRPEHFKLIYSPVPPAEEQAAIVRYLDWASERLDRVIRAKRKVIAVLNEQKQSIIDRAVTRGIDSSAALRPSGNGSLGVIPEHWPVLRFARVIKHGPQNGISPAIDDSGATESFSISAIRNGCVDIRETDRKFVSGGAELLDGGYELLADDILIVRGNGNIRLVGRAGLVAADMKNIVYPDLLMRVRVSEKLLPAFAVMLLNGPTLRAQIESAAKTAVGTFKVNNQQVRQLWIPLPSIQEQRAIIAHVTQNVEPIELAEKHAARSIEVLNEYRRRLVADVVTGKLDVREAAAKLPDTAVEPEVEPEELELEEDLV